MVFQKPNPFPMSIYDTLPMGLESTEQKIKNFG